MKLQISVYFFNDFDKDGILKFIEITNLHFLIILAFDNKLLATIIALKFE